MRRILIFSIALTVGCSSADPSGPPAGNSASPGEPPVSSIVILGPEAIRVSDSVKLSITLLDETARPVSNRPVTFASSNLRVATIDNSGLVRALAEGFVTVTASSESRRAEKILRILPPLRCSPENRECVAKEERYELVLVNGQPLPVKSPWGVGEWDYDADAGTWKVTNAEMILFSNGNYSYATVHRAASGATSTYSFGGRYELGAGTVHFYDDASTTHWYAILTASGLVEPWPNGGMLTYVRTASEATLQDD